MTTLTLTVTNAGRAEIVNATNTGTLPVEITEIALGTGKWLPDATATALNTEFKRINTIGGVAVADDTISITIADFSTDAYTLGEFGLYTNTGVLFAIHSTDAALGITDKAAGARLLITADAVFSSIAPGSITVSGTVVVNPPASETVAGVLKLATQAMADAGLDDGTAITPLKLAAIITAANIKARYESNANTNALTDALLAKLNAIESGATADQTAGEIKTAYESNTNTNALTDALLTKLTGIESGATADQTAGEIKTAYESNTNTNALTDALLAKLTGIESGATADQTAGEIKTAYESNANTNALTDALLTKLIGIETGATADQTAAEILALLLTVDGPASGVNSDLLDSQHGSFYQNAGNLNAGILPAARFSDVAHGARAGGTLHSLATTTAHGFMSSSDKSKLNGIENNAKDDQTAAEILALLLTVDGPASGLDADLFRGQTPDELITGNNLVSELRLNEIACSNWTSRAVLKSGHLREVIWTGSMFIAVGESDGADAYILTSTNGIAWSEKANPKNGNLQSIAWSGSRFVAVGNELGGEYIITSTDGITWTESVSPKNIPLWAVTWNGSKFVAVGGADGVDAFIITSTDGINWIESVNPKNVILKGIIWNGSMFVAVGYGDGVDAYILTSTDAITWTERANPKNITLHGVAWNGAMFVAVGSADGVDAYIVTSTDGITWTERANPKNSQLFAITWNGYLFVAVGGNDNEDAYLLTSTDGITWKERANPKSKSLYGITWNGSMFVSVGYSGSTPPYIATSLSI